MKQHTPGQTDQAAPSTILVVASDQQLLKLLTIALSLELSCEVLTANSASRAEEAANRLTPALMIVDEQLLDGKAHNLSARLHRIAGLEQLPTLFLNVAVPSQSQHQGYPAHFLGLSWKVETLYAAVWALLGFTS